MINVRMPEITPESLEIAAMVLEGKYPQGTVKAAQALKYEANLLRLKGNAHDKAH